MRMGGGSNLEQRLAKLENAIKVGNDGSITIESNNKIKIKSASSVEIEGGATLVIKAGANVEIRAGGALTLKGTGQTSLDGGIIRLNGGGMPLARVGDMVTTAMGPAPIIGGNPTVTA
jgi:uncharacterized protein (DUF2345 family)